MRVPLYKQGRSEMALPFPDIWVFHELIPRWYPNHNMLILPPKTEWKMLCMVYEYFLLNLKANLRYQGGLLMNSLSAELLTFRANLVLKEEEEMGE